MRGQDDISSRRMGEEGLISPRVRLQPACVTWLYFDAAGADPLEHLGEVHRPKTRIVPRMLGAD